MPPTECAGKLMGHTGEQAERVCRANLIEYGHNMYKTQAATPGGVGMKRGVLGGGKCVFM